MKNKVTEILLNLRRLRTSKIVNLFMTTFGGDIELISFYLCPFLV
jgi:hypothetical protein